MSHNNNKKINFNMNTYIKAWSDVSSGHTFSHESIHDYTFSR